MESLEFALDVGGGELICIVVIDKKIEEEKHDIE